MVLSPSFLAALVLAVAGLVIPVQAQSTDGPLASQAPGVRDLIDGNAKLRAELDRGAAEEQLWLDTQIEEAHERFNRLDTEFDRLQYRVSESGMGRASGVLLSAIARQLPSRTQLGLERRARQELVAEMELRRIQREDELALLRETELDHLVERRALLEDLHRLDEDRLAQLELWCQAERGYAALVLEASAFAGEHLIWVRTRTDPSLPSLTHAWDSLKWMLGAEEWSAGLVAVGKVLFRLPLVPFVWTLLGLSLLALRRRLTRLVLHSGVLVRSFRTDRLRHTVIVVVADLLRSAGPPALMMALSSALVAPSGQPEVVIACAIGLTKAAPLVWVLGFLSACCVPGGLGDQHLKWGKDGMATLRRVIAWFLPFAAALGVIREASSFPSTAGDHQALADLAFGLLMVGTAIALLNALARSDSMTRAITDQSPDGWLNRTRVLWAPLLVALPAACLVLGWLGWEHTAQVLLESLTGTLGLAFGVALGVSLLHRWRGVARRRLTVAEARHRHEAQREDAQSTVVEASSTTWDDDAVDVPAVDAQTRKLIHSLSVLASFFGLFLVWNTTLPVLDVLDRVQLWPSIQWVDARDIVLPGPAAQDVIAQAGSGGAASLPIPRLGASQESASLAASQASPVTLRDLVFSVFILTATWIVVRNATGVVEFLLHRRRRLSAASRFVMTTLVRYLLTLLGLGYGFVAIGIEWSEVQWLVAALTFGLAFGLQEVFANFVSGLIILFERPVRIGDTVTVGGVTGEITRIRMRATEITDWDRKELVVPNKSFITDQVVNWSLSDPILRVIVPVGVSYGSDAELVRSALLQVAEDTPAVLAEPESQALFLGFGDSALNFELRCFIASVSDLQAVRSGLHFGILRTFRKAGIEIAFPQRDLHLRSSEAKVELVSRLSPDGEGTPLDGAG